MRGLIIQNLTAYQPKRFRLCSLGILLTGMLALMSCQAKTEESFSHIVTMPKLPPELLSELKEGCEWERAEFTLFNQKDQRLKFRYQKCSSIPHIRSDLIGYNEVQTESGLPLLVIGKQGPYKPKEHMAAMIPRPTADTQCYAVKTPDNLWLLLPHEDLEGYKFSGTSRNDLKTHQYVQRIGPCGSYQGSTSPRGWVFAFNEGIVFGFFQEGVKNFIDLSSVRYENND